MVHTHGPAIEEFRERYQYRLNQPCKHTHGQVDGRVQIDNKQGGVHAVFIQSWFTHLQHHLWTSPRKHVSNTEIVISSMALVEMQSSFHATFSFSAFFFFFFTSVTRFYHHLQTSTRKRISNTKLLIPHVALLGNHRLVLGPRFWSYSLTCLITCEHLQGTCQ